MLNHITRSREREREREKEETSSWTETTSVSVVDETLEFHSLGLLRSFCLDNNLCVHLRSSASSPTIHGWVFSLSSISKLLFWQLSACKWRRWANLSPSLSLIVPVGSEYHHAARFISRDASLGEGARQRSTVETTRCSMFIGISSIYQCYFYLAPAGDFHAIFTENETGRWSGEH